MTDQPEWQQQRDAEQRAYQPNERCPHCGALLPDTALVWDQHGHRACIPCVVGGQAASEVY